MMKTLSSVSKYWKTLTKQAMEKRSKIFDADNTYDQKSISYHFNLALHPGKMYEGVSEIKFSITNYQFDSKEFFLDFQGKSVQNLIINSEIVEGGYNQEQGKIFISKDKLRKGENSIFVKYKNEYDNDGSGCVSFIDVDGKQYLYTQFQPYMANRVFPIFDQPNLKAKMNLSIHCPKEWEAVLSNQHQNTFTPLSQNIVCKKAKQVLDRYEKGIPKQYKSTSFSATKLLPSYLYCFVVGPYKKYICKNTYNNIPMNLYCIQSLYPYMEKLIPFIQEMTNLSMKFFQSYFGHPYPFSKYDQVFAHQYKWGAMQNAGIVTLNDLYIFKDKVSTQRMLSFGNTIVHELAHHWFGNLVTMRWWDDLWLNQSFAEYISHYCLEKIKGQVKTLPYESAMVSFFNRKGWGYNEDMLTTTHPIRSGVENTQVAESIFDGITYSKGAATMKQLMYLMGQQNFSKSLADYFHKFAFKNAELDDLLNCMSKYYSGDKIGLSLEEWKKMWLETSSLNEIECEVDHAQKQIIIKQSPYSEDHPHLRTHTIKIGFIKGTQIVKEKQVVVKDQPITRIQFEEKEANLLNSDAILLNYDDLSFVKAIINSQYLSYLFKNREGKVTNVNDILLRSMVWKTYYDMVKDGKVKSTQYIQALSQTLLFEKSDTILEEQLNYSLIVINKHTPLKHRSNLLQSMFILCCKYLTNINQKQDSNRTVIIKDKIIGFAKSKQQIQQLFDWFHKSGSLAEKHSLNNSLNWKIVIKILGSQHIDREAKKQILAIQIQNDQSDTMINKKHLCDALLLKQQQMDNQYNEYINHDKWSMSNYINSLSGFNNEIHKIQIANKYSEKYYDTIKKNLQNKEKNKVLLKSQMLELFVDYMDPILEDNEEELRQKIQKLKSIDVVENDKLSISIKKKVSSLEKRIKSYILF